MKRKWRLLLKKTMKSRPLPKKRRFLVLSFVAIGSRAFDWFRITSVSRSNQRKRKGQRKRPRTVTHQLKKTRRLALRPLKWRFLSLLFRPVSLFLKLGLSLIVAINRGVDLLMISSTIYILAEAITGPECENVCLGPGSKLSCSLAGKLQAIRVCSQALRVCSWAKKKSGKRTGIYISTFPNSY